MEEIDYFTPDPKYKDYPLDLAIEKRAKELATEIVMRTHATMTLEDQQNSKERIEQAIALKTAEIKFEMPTKPATKAFAGRS